MALNMLLFRLLCYAFLIVACNSSDDHFEFDFVKKTLKVEVSHSSHLVQLTFSLVAKCQIGGACRNSQSSSYIYLQYGNMCENVARN